MRSFRPSVEDPHYSGDTHRLGSPAGESEASLVLQEMQRYFEDALPRFALHGSVTLSEGRLVLHSLQGIFETSLGTLPARWNLLDEASRRERVVDILRLVVQQRPPLTPELTDSSHDVQAYMRWASLAFGVAAVALAVYLLWPSEVASSAADPASRVAREQAAEAETAVARMQRVCEATKARVARGATVSVADTDGWVIEYAALRSPGATPISDALRGFLEPAVSGGGKGRFVWPDEPKLAELPAEDAAVSVATESLSLGTENLEHVRLTFDGALVDSYFREEERARYFHIASSLTSALDARFSGLYARCAHEGTHYLGSWFHGPNESGAATALIFFVGAFAEPPHVAKPFLQPLGHEPDLGYALGSIQAATGKLTRSRLSDAMGKSQGMVTGAPKAPVLLTFGFRDGSAASRASRQLARGAGLLAD